MLFSSFFNFFLSLSRFFSLSLSFLSLSIYLSFFLSLFLSLSFFLSFPLSFPHPFIRSVILSFFHSFVLSFCRSSSFLFLFSLSLLPVRCARCRGLTFTSAHVLVSSTFRWARLATHRHGEPHHVCFPCPRAHFGRVTTAGGASPTRLGCLHRLAHAAGYGYFQGASTSRRTASMVFWRSRLKNHDPQNGESFP